MVETVSDVPASQRCLGELQDLDRPGLQRRLVHNGYMGLYSCMYVCMLHLLLFLFPDLSGPLLLSDTVL